jgi:predicted NBD/HSP70 family sugar kinase
VLPSGSPQGPKGSFKLIRTGAASRRELVGRTGMSRATVSHHADALLATGLVIETVDKVATGGRPAARLAFNAAAGVVLAAELTDDHSRLAVTDLAGRILAEADGTPTGTEGPDRFAPVCEALDALVRTVGVTWNSVHAIGVATSAPTDGSGSIEQWFVEQCDVPVVTEGLASAMALAEQKIHWRTCRDLVFVNVAETISCGILASGHTVRGASGLAGTIGHTWVRQGVDVACECGSSGCLDTLIAREVLAAGRVRDAGRLLGEVLAVVIGLFDPGVIVIGGTLADPIRNGWPARARSSPSAHLHALASRSRSPRAKSATRPPSSGRPSPRSSTCLHRPALHARA